MTFEIIRNSESSTGYDVEDKRYIGVVPCVLCGWQFEVIKNGKVGYFSVMYNYGTPEQCYEDESRYGDMFEQFNCVPTGRVIFRGYYESYWDFDEDYEYIECVREATETEEAIAKYVR